MTFTVTYRGADGAPVTEAVEAASRAECLAQMKARGTKGQKGPTRQLTKYSQEWADVILLEFADSVEEKSFTFCERKSVSKKLAGNYPRLRVARVYTSARKLLPQLARIIANDGIECKRGLSFDEVKEAA